MSKYKVGDRVLVTVSRNITPVIKCVGTIISVNEGMHVPYEVLADIDPDKDFLSLDPSKNFYYPDEKDMEYEPRWYRDKRLNKILNNC